MNVNLEALIDGLSRAGAYPHSVEAVDVRHTHISLVFLAGDWVYKVKKPVKFDFLDFGTLERRKHFCEEEVRLNRRLAPEVYEGVVPIVGDGERLRIGEPGEGEAVEWAVKMVRLPEEATLKWRLAHGDVSAAQVENLARRLAEFHAKADRSDAISRWASVENVRRNAIDNFTQTASHVGRTVSQAVHERLRELTEREFAPDRLLREFERRHADGLACDTHGDLRLDHVYLFPDRPPPADVVVIDCIEFNEAFRFADPVADMAFLVMDLRHKGRPDLARAFVEAYFTRETDTSWGRTVLPFYASYRAVVRAKVEGFKLSESEIPDDAKEAANESSRTHWLLGYSLLERASRRPAVILVGGLPGTGKSTLAKRLEDDRFGQVVRSDVVRKELAAKEGVADLYSPEWTRRTYEECLRLAEAVLFEGRRPIVDATFREERWRQAFRDLARRYCVPSLFVECRVPEEVALRRLDARTGDVSDADRHVHAKLAKEWEPAGDAFVVDMSGDLDAAEFAVNEELVRIVAQ